MFRGGQLMDNPRIMRAARLPLPLALMNPWGLAGPFKA